MKRRGVRLRGAMEAVRQAWVEITEPGYLANRLKARTRAGFGKYWRQTEFNKAADFARDEERERMYLVYPKDRYRYDPHDDQLETERGIELLSEHDEDGIPFEDYVGLSMPKWTRASETARTHELRQREARVLDLLSSSERIQWHMGIHLGYCDGCIAEARQVLPPTVRAMWHVIYSKLEKAGLRKPSGEGNRRSKDSCRKCHPAPRPALLRILALAPIRRVA